MINKVPKTYSTSGKSTIKILLEGIQACRPLRGERGRQEKGRCEKRDNVM